MRGIGICMCISHLNTSHLGQPSAQTEPGAPAGREEVLLGTVFDMLSGIKSPHCILLFYVSAYCPGIKAIEIVGGTLSKILRYLSQGAFGYDWFVPCLTTIAPRLLLSCFSIPKYICVINCAIFDYVGANCNG